MDVFGQIIIAAAAIGVIFGILWVVYGSLCTPVRLGRGIGVCTVVTARGSAEGLEQTLKGLVWLEENGIVVARILIVDCGLNEDGLALARLLAKKYANVVICQAEEVGQWIVETR